MTNEEESAARTKLDSYRATFRNGGVVPGDMAREVFALADRLLKENSELRVRDSNVTFHSRNVMGINQDLVEQLRAVNDEALARAPMLAFSSNGEAGDGQHVCTVCGAPTDEPHKASDCYRNGVAAGELDAQIEVVEAVAVCARCRKQPPRSASARFCDDCASAGN